MATDKVFSSNIRQGKKPLDNDLRELLQAHTAIQAFSTNSDSETDYEFIPKNNKTYVPKKKATKCSKVLTVRNIRAEFEKNILEYLPSELDKKEKYLYRKICSGMIDASTINLVRKIIKNSGPLKRNTFQMITNMNPDKKLHKAQYVFWNGKNIRVNGSKGGDKKFILNFDLAKQRIVHKENVISKPNFKKSLLKNSLTIKYKAGPLAKKRKLDLSYQKYNVGPTELIKLPQIGLELEPQNGKPVEPTISNIIYSQRDCNGVLTENWANFAVSTLSSIGHKEVIQNESTCAVFKLDYRNKQNLLMMRKDYDTLSHSLGIELKKSSSFITENYENDVNNVVNDILNAVEISLNQNNLYNEDVPNSPKPQINNDIAMTQTKDKFKNKFGELAKLDVTVIKLNDRNDINVSQQCNEVHCKLGCVCTSIECGIQIKNHCGRLDCMFKCICDFSRYKTDNDLNSKYSDLLPGIINLDSKIISTLTKEEQKFHQTVVLTEDKSIVLKSQRRHTKAPKRYAEFLENDVQLPSASPIITPPKPKRRFLSIPLTKIPCRNIEPWCLVHNLYRCFCQGKFTETSITAETEDECIMYESDENKKGNDKKSSKDRLKLNENNKTDDVITSSIQETEIEICSRTQPFTGRRFSDTYYKDTNRKIYLLEEHDKNLSEKLMNILHKSLSFENESRLSICSVSSSEELSLPADKAKESDSITAQNSKQLNKSILIQWLEVNYKKYKTRLETRKTPIPLEAPKLGKISLYPWEVILQRYTQSKNYFLVTQEKPFRIFMAVDLENPFFENCINIDDIHAHDLSLYPSTVQNLLQRVTTLKDNFFILCGLTDCWELIGSVTKITEKSDDIRSNKEMQSTLNSSNQTDVRSVRPQDENIVENWDMTPNEQSEISNKWFIMTVENDFTEIQFTNKGFFVKHDNILKAINYARSSGKTVRLSSQKFTSSQNKPTFGLYAIPSADQIRVFIGPYEDDEPLGINIMKRLPYRETKHTTGFWISTKKVDNSKVVDNPMSFIPKSDQEEIIISNNNKNEDGMMESVKGNLDQVQKSEKETYTDPSKVKLVKPIKLTRNNGFYQLSESGDIKSVSLLKKPMLDSIPSTSKVPHLVTPIIKDTFSLSSLIIDKHKLNQKPIAEIAPQLKSSSSCAGQQKKGMFILKPEEINEKHSQLLKSDSENECLANVNDEMDIEHFLSANDVCKPPVFVISDDEKEDINDDSTKEDFENVWIECVNIDSNLGSLKGKRNKKDEISFEFPGFKFTEFYSKEEAFEKINQVLSRKVYIPKDTKLEWTIVDKKENLRNPKLLTNEHLRRNVILTNKGLRSSKGDAFKDLKSGLNYLRDTIVECSDDKHFPKDTPVITMVDKATTLIKHLESTRTYLENEKDDLQLEASARKSRLLNLLLQAKRGVKPKIIKD